MLTRPQLDELLNPIVDHLPADLRPDVDGLPVRVTDALELDGSIHLQFLDEAGEPLVGLGYHARTNEAIRLLPSPFGGAATAVVCRDGVVLRREVVPWPSR